MITDTVDLYDYFNIDRQENQKGYLKILANENFNEINAKRKYPAMLIIAGGGYSFVSQRETEPVAYEYLVNGFNTFILDYSVAPCSYPTQLIEAAMAMVYIRENADKYNIISNKVAAIGFSAGGHLCGCLATIHGDKNISDRLGEERSKSVAPDAVILSYAVLSSADEISHKGSFQKVSAGKAELIEYLSLENRVDENSVPAFIWHSAADNAVPVENSIYMALKYKKFNIPFELHV